MTQEELFALGFPIIIWLVTCPFDVVLEPVVVFDGLPDGEGPGFEPRYFRGQDNGGVIHVRVEMPSPAVPPQQSIRNVVEIHIQSRRYLLRRQTFSTLVGELFRRLNEVSLNV